MGESIVVAIGKGGGDGGLSADTSAPSSASVSASSSAEESDTIVAAADLSTLIEQQQQEQVLMQHNKSTPLQLVEALSTLLCPSLEDADADQQQQQLQGPMPFDLERQLVVWVLLTRLDSDKLEDVWTKYGAQLERFAIDILLQPAEDTSLDQHMLVRYLRLVAQVTARLPMYPKALGQALFYVYKSLPVNGYNLEVHVDVCSSLEVFLQADPVLANALSMLETIWSRYLEEIDRWNRSSATAAAATTTSTATTGTVHEPSNNEVDDIMGAREWNMMGETLDKILSNNDSNSSSSNYSWTAYHELILGIFSQENIEEIIPVTMVSSLLQWVTHPPQSLEASLGMAWKEWCLTWITTRTTQHAAAAAVSSSVSKSCSAGGGSQQLLQDPFSQALLQQPETLAQLHHMLLSHVVSPQQKEDSALRAMAWQALVALVEINGWDWMLTSTSATLPASNSIASAQKLGRGTLLCTWIRLASGELRIQLQPLVMLPEERRIGGSSSSTTHHSAASSPYGGWRATGLPIGHGCARLLQSVVRYLIRLADQCCLEGDALLHLRQSLEQALWTSVEYLSLTTVMTTGNILDATLHDDRASLFHAILRLLGTLLMEVDIFDLLEKNHSTMDLLDDDNVQDEQHSSPVVILTCLQRILPIADDPSLFPGLVHILGDAEEDPDKNKLLVEHLYDSLLDYLEWYWQRGSTTHNALNLLDDTVAWACSCTELWVQLSSNKADTIAVAQHRRRLCLALLTWIQQILQTSHPSSRNYMSLSLGCYMTLSKDRSEPPKEHETRVILRALQWCELG